MYVCVFCVYGCVCTLCVHSMFPERDALVAALLTTFSVALASTLVFVPVLRDRVPPSSGVLAPTWALILTQFHAGSVFADGIRSILGAVLGAAGGAAAFAIAESFPLSSESIHEIATVFAIPFAFVIVLADPIVGSPLKAWMEPGVALLSLYIVASFSRLTAYESCLNCIISFSYGSVCAMLVSALFRFATSLGSTRTVLSFAVDDFCAKQTHWLEGLLGFMTCSSGDHSCELSIRQDAATEALAALQRALSMAKSTDPWSVLRTLDLAQDLSVTMVLMHSQLLAFRGAIVAETYGEDSLRVQWAPVLESFSKLRMCVVLALRPSTPYKVRRHSHISLKQEGASLYQTLIANAAITALNRHADLPHGGEVVRFHFAMVSLVRFALLVDRFLDSVDDAIVLNGPWTSLRIYSVEKMNLLFSVAGWRKTGSLVYAYRAVLAQQIVSQTALAIARADPADFGKYILWAQLPIVFCFLPSVGGTLLKGGRRVLGTLAGGAIACLTAIANPGAESSYFLEMLIFAFIGKMCTFHPRMGYASLVFAFTWFICMLTSVTVLEVSTLLNSVFYRMVLTVGGVVASSLLSATLFPSFSSTEMRSSMRKSVVTCTALVVDSIQGVTEGVPFQENSELDQVANISVEMFKGAGERALKSLQKHIVVLNKLCVEARAEVSFMRNFCLVTDTCPSLQTVTEAEHGLYNFIDSVLVLTATGAATRISQYAHSAFFNDQVIDALHAFGGKCQVAGNNLAEIVGGIQSFQLEDCYCSDKLQHVERSLMVNRQILGETKKLPLAVKGGSPLIYVYLYALTEMANRWDNFVRELAGLPDTIMPSMRTSFKRENSSSSLNIL